MTNATRYPRLFERLYGRGLMMHRDLAFSVERAFQAQLELPTEQVRTRAFYDPDDDGDDDSTSPTDGYTVTAGGVAVVPVMGTLVQRSSWLDAMCGMTSYASIGTAIANAEADPKVKGILLEIDSGGGEVNGCFDLADEIAASTKPVWAVANEAAYSAAYAIASAADKLFMPRTAGVGSIGVIALHVDQSERDKKMGYSYTPIFAGDHKFDGNSHEPLPDDVQASIQADIDRLYQLFVTTVALNRGMSADAVIATQADVFHTGAAIDLGLADATGTLTDAISQFEDFLDDDDNAPSRNPMSAPSAFPSFATAAAAANMKGVLMDPKTTAADSASNTVSQAALESSVAQARTAGRDEGVSVGAENERKRVAAILGSDEAKDRAELANHLALETDMSAEAAVKLLSKSPKATPAPAARGNAFEAAMAGTENPNVGADADPDASSGDANVTEEAKEATKVALRIVSAANRAPKKAA